MVFVRYHVVTVPTGGGQLGYLAAKLGGGSGPLELNKYAYRWGM